MKNIILYILIPLLFLISCSENIKKDEPENIKPETILQTVAAFKSAEFVDGNEWKLIFRRVDDCQYIVLYTDISKIGSFKDKLIINDENSNFINHDYLNLRFNIYYTEESSSDPLTGKPVIFNKLKNIERSPSDRFAVAGFENDIAAEDFILDLKKYVKTDSTSEISDMISYPLSIRNKKNSIKINNPESFIKDYKIIFNKKVKTSILDQPLADIMANSKGLMIGAGEIWISVIDSKIHITSINN